MKIRIERPTDKVDMDVRVFLDDVEVSHGVQKVDLGMEVGTPTLVTITFLGEVEIQTVDRAIWRAGETA